MSKTSLIEDLYRATLLLEQCKKTLQLCKTLQYNPRRDSEDEKEWKNVMDTINETLDCISTL